MDWFLYAYHIGLCHKRVKFGNHLSQPMEVLGEGK